MNQNDNKTVGYTTLKYSTSQIKSTFYHNESRFMFEIDKHKNL